MSQYIDAEKLLAEIEKLLAKSKNDEERAFVKKDTAGHLAAVTKTTVCVKIKKIITSLQQEQSEYMIQWTGHNLKEVIDFTGKSPRFGEWFKSWEEYENYVHTHNDILKLFCEDGSHYEVPVGAWIVKTPDGYNVPSVARFIYAKQEQSETDGDDGKFVKISVRKEVAEQLQRLGDEIQAGQSSFIRAMTQQEQPEPVKGKFVFPKLLYARTLDNKTIDVSYGPQDTTAIEYVRNDFVEQEQPEQPEVSVECYVRVYPTLDNKPRPWVSLCKHGISCNSIRDIPELESLGFKDDDTAIVTIKKK